MTRNAEDERTAFEPVRDEHVLANADDLRADRSQRCCRKEHDEARASHHCATTLRRDVTRRQGTSPAALSNQAPNQNFGFNEEERATSCN